MAYATQLSKNKSVITLKKNFSVMAFIFLSLSSYGALFDKNSQILPDVPHTVLYGKVNWEQPSFKKNHELNAVVRIRSDLTNVSSWAGTGAIIAPPGRSPTAPALVLTAGHVAIHSAFHDNFITTNVVNQSPLTAMTVITNLFLQTPEGEVKFYTVKRVIFAIMNGVDIALLELNVSLSDLQNQGINPLPIAKQNASVNEKVRGVGIPDFMEVISIADGTLGPITGSDAVVGSQQSKAYWPQAQEIFVSAYNKMSGGPILNSKNEIIGVYNTSGTKVNYMQPVWKLSELFVNGNFQIENIKTLIGPTRSTRHASCSSLIR